MDDGSVHVMGFAKKKPHWIAQCGLIDLSKVLVIKLG